MTKSIPVVISKVPRLELVSSSEVSAGKLGTSIQVNWNIYACGPMFSVMPDVPWILRSGTCTSASNPFSMEDVGEGCVAPGGMFGKFGRTWRTTENTSGADRTGHINVTVDGGGSAQVTVTQAGGSTVCSSAQIGQVGAAAVSLPKTSSSVTTGFSVSNVGPVSCSETMSITWTSSATWLIDGSSHPSTMVLMPGISGGFNANFTAAANDTGAPRSATITMSFSGGRSSIVYAVTQAGT